MTYRVEECLGRRHGRLYRRLSLHLRRLFCYFFLSGLCLLCLIPFAILALNATHHHSEILRGFSVSVGSDLASNLTKLFADENLPILKALANSLVISLCAACATAYFSAMTAYGLIAYRFKLNRVAFTFILSVMLVPTQVSALGFIHLMMTMHLMDTFHPLILPAVANPIAFFYLYQYTRSTLPLEIVESARVDGSGEFRTFNIIVLPLLSPALAVQGIFAFVGSWNTFFLPALILTAKGHWTVPILIAELRNSAYSVFDLGKVYAMLAIAILPLIAMYLFFSRFIQRGLTLGSVK